MFDKIIGNDQVKKNLLKAVENNTLANTLLFSGPDGIGKSLFAKALASHVMYDKIDHNNIRKIENNYHPDLHMLIPEGKTGMHNIASIREMIEQVFFAPFEAKSKVFIIYDADRMLPSSSNALLKTLEEPTLDSYIILLSSKSDDLLPTIVSRSSKINFENILEDEIVKFLIEHHNKNMQEAKTLATLSNGSIGYAIELANHPSYIEKRDLFIKILAKENISSYYELSDSLLKLEEFYNAEKKAKDFEEGLVSVKWHKEIDFLFSQLSMWYRDLHLLKAGASSHLLYYFDKSSLLKKQNFNKLPSLEKVHDLIEESKLALNRNVNFKICLEQLFSKLDFID